MAQVAFRNGACATRSNVTYCAVSRPGRGERCAAQRAASCCARGAGILHKFGIPEIGDGGQASRKPRRLPKSVAGPDELPDTFRASAPGALGVLDEAGLTREVRASRPITLTQTGMMLIAMSHNKPLAASGAVCGQQRRFVAGRVLGDNLLEWRGRCRSSASPAGPLHPRGLHAGVPDFGPFVAKACPAGNASGEGFGAWLQRCTPT